MRYQNLLLIDDDEDDQEIFLLALSKIQHGINCTTFSNAAHALDELISKIIVPDLILVDLNMPVMSGQQFLLEIKKIEKLQIIPVIIFTTSSHLPTKELMMDLGANDFITKPENFSELINLLSGLLN
jgi:DNA-binding response OmpR family regulator